MPDNAKLLPQLRDNLQRGFSQGELRSLCLDLDVDYDELTRQTKSEAAIDLVGYMDRRGRLPELIQRGRELRPHLDWPDASLELVVAVSAVRRPDNPFFIGGRIHNPDDFFGRERLLREIQNDLGKGNSVALIGGERMGKSSLLIRLRDSRETWLPGRALIWLDLQGVMDEADFCETVLGKLGQPGDNLRALKRALAGYRGALLLDEFERLAEADFNPRLLDLLRSLAQEPGFALCVAAERPLSELFPAAPGALVSPFHNIFTTRRLEPWTAAECGQFLAGRLAAAGLTFSPAEIEEVVKASQGSPGRLQQLAWALAERKR